MGIANKQATDIPAFEVCACAKPAIVTDRCGIANVVDSQLGFVVRHDREQLANAILHVLTDDKLRRQFGEKGRLLVREKFNWEKIAQQVEDIYSSCALSNR